MGIVNSDDYEKMAATYQCIEIARLNDVLKQHGIRDVQLRKAICTDYFFDSGQFLDCGWFKSSGKKLWPELSFAERPLDPNEGRGEIETLHLYSEHFSFHEYAHGDIAWYFDDHNEDASGIDQGTV